MPVETTCPKGHPLRVAEEHFGLKVRCPTCGEVFVLQAKPRQPTFADSPPPAASPMPEPAAFESPSAELNGGERSKGPLLAGLDVFHAAKAWGQPLVLVGLLLVAGARGCDRLGAAGAERDKARVAVAQAEWERDWQDRQQAIERELDDLTSADRDEPLTESQRKRRDELQRELNETLPKKKREEQADLEQGAWRELRFAATLANERDTMARYWRELSFVGGTFVLLAGLMVVGFNSQGPERWACLLLLAIIALTFYGLNVGAAVTSR